MKYDHRTIALFWETALEADRAHVKWTLKSQEHMGYPSLYLEYMRIADPSEYFFATKVIGSWEHWERISGSSYLKPTIDKWRKELEVKIKAQALAAIQDKALMGDVSAAKYLIENWSAVGGLLKVGEKKGRGRPKKEKEDNELNIDWKKDLERIQDDNR